MSTLEDMRKQMKIPKEPQRGQQRERGIGRTVTVKNKAPAPVQITAEQLLRESHEFVESEVVAPKQQISDMEELQTYRLRKRQEFENAVRRNRMNIGAWVKYATWEASQKEFERARSVFERALDVDYRNQSLWLKYAEMEMSNRFVQHARNIWDRAVQLMPRVEQFWFKYSYMEEMLGNAANARAIFERWMTFHPDKNAWSSYIKFEMRMKQIDRARAVYERFLADHTEISTYLQYAKFEIKHGDASRARTIYERAMSELGEDANDEQLFIAFAAFEQSHKEYERARVIYKYALDHVSKHRAETLYRTYTAFEKQYGDREGVDQVILAKRRFQYEEELATDPHNYDVWFDYLRLEESKGEIAKIRELYERAVAQLPLVSEKRYWQRYIYIWINWVLYEELEAKDINRTREIYKKILDLIPHKEFTFSKIWMMYAHFEIRQKNLDGARKILGSALGKCPRESLFKGYLEIESQLANIDRCRKLYEKYLEFMPENCQAWTKYAELEASLSEHERARAIFNLAISQPILDMPELLWKAYIDFEIAQGDWDRVRNLYEQLLTRTKHVKVWISRAQFEVQSTKQIERARTIYTEADAYLKQQQNKEERVILLESWRDFEKQHGTAEQLRVVTAKMPKKVKKKRKVTGEDGVDLGWEEYYDYIFPDDAAASGSLAILERARLWKKQKLMQMQEEQETEMDVEGEGEGEGEGEEGEGEGDEQERGNGQEEEEQEDEDSRQQASSRNDGGGDGSDEEMGD